ncbi:MAG: hypothetical protein P8M30_18915 [Planctomycetaceae bacterium]|nr:hypothetical protein [Planctomycetaceae bacterium]
MTAQHFGKTPTTILTALKFAKKEYGIDAMGKKISVPTRPNWKRENAQRGSDH